MILRFHGGPMDGLEEPHADGEAPFMLMRTPPLGDMLHAAETADAWDDALPTGGTYRLERVADGVAHYRAR